MSDALQNLIPGVLMAGAAFLASKNDAFKSGMPKSFKTLTRTGIFLIGIFFIYLVYNYCKDVSSEIHLDTAKAEEGKAKDTLRQRDMEIKKYLEENNRLQRRLETVELNSRDTITYRIATSALDVIKASNKTIRQYNTVLQDSINKMLAGVNAKAIPEGEFRIMPVDENGRQPLYIDGTEINIRIQAINNSCYNLDLDGYFIYNEKIIKHDRLTYKNTLTTGSFSTAFMNFPAEFKDTTKYVTEKHGEAYFSGIILLLKGAYTTDRKGKNIVPIEEAWIYDFAKDKMVISVSNDYLQKMEKRLNINN